MAKLNWTKEEKEEAIERMRANLPPDMLKYNNFVCFSLEPDTTSHSGYSKKPKNPKKPKNAKSNDPTTWGSFDEAAGAWIKSSALHGIGFMFGNSPFFGVDIDDMGDKLNSRDFDGADMVQALHTYTEYSPSGTGLHCICIGELPPKDRKHGKFEMYSDGRFFTMTGNVYANPRTISDCTESIKPYHEKYIVIPKREEKEAKKKAKEAKKPTQTTRPAAVGTLAEDEIIRKASNAANGSTFKALYFDGDTSAYGGDDSAADMALCNLLAFWTGKNAGTMDTLFRKSALYRPKWDEKRGTETYGEITINEAINFCDRCYEGGSAPKYIIASPDFVAYNFDGTPETSTAAGTAAPATDTDDIPAIIEQDPEKWTEDQWEKAYQYNCKVQYQTARVLDQFIRLYRICYKNKYLNNRRLPDYIQPVIKTRSDHGMIYVSTVGFKINPIPLARDIVKTLNGLFVTSAANQGLLYIYTNGRYEAVSLERERGIIRERLETIDKGGYIWDTKTVKDCMTMLHSPSKEQEHKLDDFNANESIINFKNGLLDINTGEIAPHTPDELTTVQLPLIYDPNAGTDTPTFDKMIEHLSSGREDVKRLLLQICALAISNVNVSNLKVFLLIYGAKNSGKSKFFTLLERLLGKENTHSTSLYLIEENRFETMNIYGKRLIGHAELDNNSVVHHVGILKSITGGDNVRGEIKCGGAFNFVFKGIVSFSSNSKPRLPSADDAFYDRLRLVGVKQSVPKKDEDPELIEKMLGERQQIINKLLPYLKEVITTHSVIDPESSLKEKRQYRAENSIEVSFFNDCCCKRDQLKTITDGQTETWIYTRFREYCEKRGIRIIPEKSEFETRLEQFFLSENYSWGIKIRKSNGRFYTFTYHDPATMAIKAP